MPWSTNLPFIEASFEMPEPFFLFPHFSAKCNSFMKILICRLGVTDLRPAGEDSAREQHWEGKAGTEQVDTGKGFTWELTMKSKAEFQSTQNNVIWVPALSTGKVKTFLTKMGSRERTSGKVHQKPCVNLNVEKYSHCRIHVSITWSGLL